MYMYMLLCTLYNVHGILCTLQWRIIVYVFIPVKIEICRMFLYGIEKNIFLFIYWKNPRYTSYNNKKRK